ncbi:MAG: hypothetical protein CMI02_09690 [Oceanospirillaceae bacterium]|nr:hypothetical protein [Oceanospirillaceae bacterium]
MAYTQQDLQRLDDAIAAGVLRVTHNGKTTEYRSLDDMIRTRNLIVRQLQQGQQAVRRPYAPTFDRGYQ